MTRWATASAAVFIAALALAPSALSQPPTAPPESPSVPPALEACIRANADQVERGVEDLAKATDFLVSDVCAVESTEAIMDWERARARASTELQRRVFEAQCAAQRARPPSAQTKDDPDYSDACTQLDRFDQYSPLGRVVTFSAFAPNAKPPPGAIALAAKLLLDRRTARTPR